jgi:hypothetical protein
MPANNYCELELRIQWLDRGVYFIGANFVDSVSDLENDILDPIRIAIDLDRLRDLALDADAYGTALTQMLFGGADNAIRLAFRHARTAAASREGLRIRLSIQTSAPELHAVRWETLRDPDTGFPLLTQAGIWFSRFLSAEDFRLRQLRDQDTLQTLIVIANPSDIQSKWGQPELQPDDEYDKAVRAIRTHADPGAREITVRRLSTKATLYNIISDLRDSYSDVVYLACHGTLTEDGEPRLLLENDLGTGEMVRGEQLVERLSGMSERPRLVVLTSCQSAGGRSGLALGAIGPRLAHAGIPSVIAMQGDVTVKSIDKFMPRLFRELATDGQIDRAMAVARSDIRDEADWWMPALFMRSRTGCLWPGRVADADAFEQWDAVITDLTDRHCVPVLGPSLVESLFGTTRDIARRWAEQYEFPLAPRDRDDLAQVAQYLTYRQSSAYALQELRTYLVRYIRRKYEGELPAEMMTGPVHVGLVNTLVSQIGAMQRRNDVNDAHRLLAKLPVNIYVNANRDNLLRDALIEAGRKPHIQLCTWRTKNDMPVPMGPPLEKKYEPSEQEPLIFHVFGNLEYPESMVLTEDDYFNFLIAVTRNEALRRMSIPPKVSTALASSGLLLLGFQVDDWDFRVLFSSILKQPGGLLSEQRTRVAIQMNPVEGRIIDPDRASQYLRKYFERQARINVFWGTADEFLVHLTKRCIESGLIAKSEA